MARKGFKASYLAGWEKGKGLGLFGPGLGFGNWL